MSKPKGVRKGKPIPEFRAISLANSFSAASRLKKSGVPNTGKLFKALQMAIQYDRDYKTNYLGRITRAVNDALPETVDPYNISEIKKFDESLLKSSEDLRFAFHSAFASQAKKMENIIQASGSDEKLSSRRTRARRAEARTAVRPARETRPAVSLVKPV